jgi:hypothetical protein
MKAPTPMEQTLAPTDDPAWVLHADGYDALCHAAKNAEASKFNRINRFGLP